MSDMGIFLLPYIHIGISPKNSSPKYDPFKTKWAGDIKLWFSV